jgi:biotin carboxylase
LSKEILVIIGAGKHQKGLIQTAGKMGLYTVAVDVNPQAEGFVYADEAVVENSYDDEMVWRRICERTDLPAIRGVMTQAARGCILTVSKLSERLGLRHLRSEVADLVIDKARCAKLFNVESFIGVYSSAEEIKKHCMFPCVVRFNNTSGGVGVSILNNDDDVDCVRTMLTQTGSAVVEKYVQGRSFSIVGMRDGAGAVVYGILEKYVNPDLTIDYTVMPACVSSEEEEALLDYTYAMLDRIGFDFGPFQLELLWDGRAGPFFVELEPSVVGSYISELMVPGTSGNDMISDSINLVCEGTIRHGLSPNRYVCVQKYHYAERCGSIKAYTLTQASKGILFKPYIQIGEYVGNVRQSVAHSLVFAKEINEAQRYLRNFRLTVEVTAGTT